jgi:hypothetical protein
LETAAPTRIQLSIIDIQGKVLAKYSDTPFLIQGGEVLTWGIGSYGGALPPGIYYLVLSAEKEVLTRKIVILEKY